MHDAYFFKPNATVLQRLFDVTTAVFRLCLLAKVCNAHQMLSQDETNGLFSFYSLQTCARASYSWDEKEKSERNVIDSNKIAI